MYSGNLINDLIAMVERVEARLDSNDQLQTKLVLWGAVITQQASTFNPNLAGVA